MGKYMNDVKKQARYLNVDRMIAALGRDEALRLLNEIDEKAPQRGYKTIEAIPLTADELEKLLKAATVTSWSEIAKIIDAKTGSTQYCFGKLAYRYLHNLNK